MTYNYIISNGHHLVEIDNKIFIIDTGSPNSFSLRSATNLNINYSQFNLISMPIDVARTEELVGHHLDGFIGLDILKKLNSIVFNKDTMKISFDEQINRRADSVNLVCNGCFIIDITINNKEVHGVFDTGATINYYNGEIAYNETIDDYHPHIGSIQAPYGRTNVAIGNKEYILGFANMRNVGGIIDMVASINADAIVGINDLFKHRLEINFREMFINID